MPENQPLFDPADFPPNNAAVSSGASFASLPYPLWTEHKARLIWRYLYYFVMITRHGTYIDGFAGPQNDHPEMWAAKLVLESEPRWLRHFYLVELDKKKIPALESLRTAETNNPTEPPRTVDIYQGDFNEVIDRILATGSISAKEAAFCLLDQRTFECRWESLRKLAQYKPAGQHKIELFYFLAISWLDRAFAAVTKNPERVTEWWGRPDWDTLRNLSNQQRAEAFVQRIRDELGYVSVTPWPIYEAQGSARIMYFMIHATDHPEAPKLMRRAYTRAVDPIEPKEQLQLAWESGTLDA